MRAMLARTIPTTIAILGAVVCVYGSLIWAGFVWDDKTCFHDAAWQAAEGVWPRFLLRGFCDWVDYFRPLAVMLFMFEIRAFDVAPGPMHLVSLGMHLVNTLLIGLLTSQVSQLRKTGLAHRWAAISMLFYGLHPALIEPVSWIGCQAELGVVMCILAGLILNLSIASPLARTMAVSLCFFAAAGFKEAAVAFPPLLVLFDCMREPAQPDEPAWRSRLSQVWNRQRMVYAGVMLAGIAYLALRYWALGHTVTPRTAESVFTLERLQRVSFTYLSYWKLILWPMMGLGPIHTFASERFTAINLQSVLIDMAAAGIALGGIYALCRRLEPGFLIAAVTVAMLPALNVVPVAFNESLYHDRYVMTAVAVSCVLMPWLMAPVLVRGRRLLRVLVTVIGVVWLAFAVANIRVTIPLWTDELGLWQWALRENPDSSIAQSHLLSTYLVRGDFARARPLADALMAADPPCVTCIFNSANLAFAEHDSMRATRALDRLKELPIVAHDSRLLHGYVFASGQLLELRNDLAGAESAYRDAIRLDPDAPLPQMALASALAKQGRIEEARNVAKHALPYFPPDERELQRVAFERDLSVAAGGAGL